MHYHNHIDIFQSPAIPLPRIIIYTRSNMFCINSHITYCNKIVSDRFLVYSILQYIGDVNLFININIFRHFKLELALQTIQ